MDREPVGWLLVAGTLATLAACSDDDETPRGTDDAGGYDAAMDASGEDPPPGSLPRVPVVDAGFILGDAGSSECSSTLGVECDGAEDCPGEQVCCGTYSQASFGYLSMVCADTCGEMNQRELCHPGDTCADPEFVCRASQLLPFSFLSICAAPTNMVGDATGTEIAGQIVCGDDTCEVGTEQCCLRSGIDLEAFTRNVLDPVCIPLEEECSCELEIDDGPDGIDGGRDERPEDDASAGG